MNRLEVTGDSSGIVAVARYHQKYGRKKLLTWSKTGILAGDRKK
ncbi:hypothetical protein ACFL5F_04990 [Planctomycetota bacterium]